MAIAPDGDTITGVSAVEPQIASGPDDDPLRTVRLPPGHSSPSAATTVAPAAVTTALPSPGPPSSPPSDRGSSSPPGGRATPSGDLVPGQTFGRYRIIKLLGSGGMGAVYQAWDEELGLVVALKVIRPDITGDPQGAAEIERRFKRELILARQVTHRNVIRIHDLGDIDGIKYITMQFVNGPNLSAVLKERGKLPVAEALRIARQVASGLVAAHEVGIVHRDLKPGNIMLDADERVFIVDFGIARAVDAALTSNAVVGTLAYMAPEQAKGSLVDHRVDIYSFGLVLYDMLVGTRRMSGAQTAAAELIARMQQPPPAVRSIDPAVPEGLDRVITRCLQPEPAQRYATTADLLAEIERLDTDGHATVPIIAVTPPVVAAPVWKRRRLVVASVVAATLVAGATSAVLMRDRFIRRPATQSAESVVSLAVLPFRNASGDPSIEWLGDSLAEMLSGDVSAAGGYRVVATDRIARLIGDLRISPSMAFDGTTIRRVGDFSNAKIVVFGKFIKTGGQAIRVDATVHDLSLDRDSQLSVQARDQNSIADAVHELARSIRQRSGASEPAGATASAAPLSRSPQAVHEYNLGLQLARDARYAEALKHFEAATTTDPKFAAAFSKSAEMYAKLRQDNKAEQVSRAAVDLAVALPSRERLLIEARHARLGSDPAKAIEAYKRVLAISPQDTDVQFELGQLYETTGSYDEARDRYQRVLAADPNNVDALYSFGRIEILRKNPQGALDPLSHAMNLATQFNNDEARATILNALGIAYKRLDRPEDALQYYEQSIAIKRRLGQKGGIASSLAEIGQIQLRLGKPDEALKSYQEALAIRREMKDKKGTSNTLIDLAGLNYDRGRYDEALTGYREALQIEREIGDRSYEALCLNNIGSAYLAKGLHSEALTYFERALEIREKLKEAANTAETLHNIGEALVRQGRYQAALDNYTKSLDLYRSAGDKQKTAILSYSIGQALEYEGRFGAALNSKQDALKAFRDLHDRGFWLAEILSGYGNTLDEVGRSDEARKNLAEALALARQLQNGALIAQVFNFEGVAATYRGDWRAAAASFTDAQREATKAGDEHQMLMSDINLAKVALAQGRSQAAIPKLEAAIKKAEQLGLPYLGLDASISLAEARLQAGQAARAGEDLQTAIGRAQDAGLLPLLARGHYLYGNVMRATHQAQAAGREYGETIKVLEQIRQEAGDPNVITKRADFEAMRRESEKWAKATTAS